MIFFIMFLKIKFFFIDNLFWFLSSLSFIVLVAFFFFTYFYFGNFPSPFTVYLQHPDEQKLLGDIGDIYKYGIFGLVVFLTDFGLGYFLRNRINPVAVFLSSFNLIIQIILFIILMQIYSLN